MPKLNEFLFGGKDKIKQETTLTPLQAELKKLISDALKGGDNPLSGIFGAFDKDAFQEGVANPALKTFQEEILPQIQEKFIAGNQVLGSGMRRGQLKAAGDFQAQLAQLMYEAQQKHKENQLQGINQTLGSKDVENFYKQGEQGVVPGFVQGVGQGLGKAAGAAIAG